VKAGSASSQLVHQADLLATFADVLNAKLPDNAAEDSFSLLPLLKGADKPIRQHAVSASIRGVPCFRDGPWKLILAPGSGGWTKGEGDDAVQLYNLSKDLGEKNNLASAHPKRVVTMKKQLEQMITRGRSNHGAAQKNDVQVRRYPIKPRAKKK
jgi:arylsulfatase A